MIPFSKFFDPALTFNELTCREPSSNPWESKTIAKLQAYNLGYGLTVWSTLCILSTGVATLLAALGVLSWAYVVWPLVICAACALVMLIGNGIGCLKHLRLEEFFEQLARYFRSDERNSA